MANQVSRRELLKTLGIGAAGVSLFGFGAKTAMAQTTPIVRPLASVYSFALGDWEMTVIKDAAFTPNATIFGVNQDEADVLAVFDAAHVLKEDNTIDMLVDILIARAGDELILFDTGFGPGGGALVPTMEALGIAREDVTAVINSHFHGDHINGVSNDEGLVYPNAMVYTSQPEFDFLQNAPSDVSGGPLGKLQPAIDSEMISFYGDGDEVLPGITAMHVPGHTPGQMNFRLESNGDQLIHLIDTVLRPEAHLPNPDWHSQFDGDGAQAAESRRAILEMAAADSIPVFGYHWTFPGIGYVDADGDDFAYTPVAF